MAKHCGLSQTAVSRIWRAFALQPHRAESFKLSTDPLSLAKVRDIVGLYLNPPDKALVLCADEKTQIQAQIACSRFCRCARSVERRTHDYRRHGTTTLLLPWRPPREGDKLHVHLLRDSYSTHKTPLTEKRRGIPP
jgi:hypothetical protein